MASGLPAHLQGIRGPLESRTYTFPRFLQRVVPFVRRQETRSPYYRLYYVFEHEDRRDFLDLTGTIDEVLNVLTYVAANQHVPLEEVFEKVTVYGSGKDVHLPHGYTNVAAENNTRGFMRNRHTSARNSQQRRLQVFEEETPMGQTLPLNVLHQIRKYAAYPTRRRRRRRGRRDSRRGI